MTDGARNERRAARGLSRMRAMGGVGVAILLGMAGACSSPNAVVDTLDTETVDASRPPFPTTSGDAGKDNSGDSSIFREGFKYGSECLAKGKRIMIMDGDPDDPIHAGKKTYETGGWLGYVGVNNIGVSVRIPGDQSFGRGVTFFSNDGDDTPLVGLYESATHPPQPGSPAIEAASEFGSCKTGSTGRFEVLEVSLFPDQTDPEAKLNTFTAVFEHHCKERPTGILQGCLHYERPTN